MELKKSIAWRKWLDPYGKGKSDFLGYVEEDDVVDYDNNLDDMYEDEEINIENPSPVIVTAMGIMPIQPFNDLTKVFNFWLAETNFNITEDIVNEINNVDGIEILDVYTRYKFRVAIGNLFKFQEVRLNLEKILGV